LGFAQRSSPQREATLDQDATLVESFKQEALPCYQGYKAYQPLTTYWAEQAMVVHSQFRDGNVPAHYGNLEVLQEALAALPEGVVKVYFRGDTAPYQRELLRYCAEGKNERFGVIEFAVGVDVTEEFKRAVAGVEEDEWYPLEREVDGRMVKPATRMAPPIAFWPFGNCSRKRRFQAWRPSSPFPAWTSARGGTNCLAWSPTGISLGISSSGGTGAAVARGRRCTGL
jgi:quinol monooxygenase YgiN